MSIHKDMNILIDICNNVDGYYREIEVEKVSKYVSLENVINLLLDWNWNSYSKKWNMNSGAQFGIKT